MVKRAPWPPGKRCWNCSGTWHSIPRAWPSNSTGASSNRRTGATPWSKPARRSKSCSSSAAGRTDHRLSWSVIPRRGATPLTDDKNRFVCPTRSRKAADGAGFVFVNVEDGIQLGDLQQVLHPLVQVEQLQLPAAVGHGGKARYQLADPRAVDIGNVPEVEQDLFLVLPHHVSQGFAKRTGPFAESDSTGHVHHGDVAHLPSSQLNAHWISSWNS